MRKWFLLGMLGVLMLTILGISTNGFKNLSGVDLLQMLIAIAFVSALSTFLPAFLDYKVARRLGLKKSYWTCLKQLVRT